MTSLRKLGRSIWMIILCESMAALIIVTGGVYLLTRDLPLALIFGALAPATAPAGTIAVIQECRAKGKLTKSLYAVAGFDDGAAIILFGFASALARIMLIGEEGGGTRVTGIMSGMVKPLEEIVLSLIVGAVIGFIYTWLVRRLQHHNEIPALTFGMIAIGTGLAAQFHLSLILVNMTVGFILVNRTPTTFSQTVSGRLRPLMPMLFILFFFLAGAHLDLSMIPQVGLIGIVYIFTRSAGKISGARLGAVLGGADDKIRKYLGPGLLSQAGVAVGLSLLVFQDFQDLPGEHSTLIAHSAVTTIAATCIFFEIIGPILTKRVLKKAGEIPQETA